MHVYMYMYMYVFNYGMHAQSTCMYMYVYKKYILVHFLVLKCLWGCACMHVTDMVPGIHSYIHPKQFVKEKMRQLHTYMYFETP